MVIIYKSKHKIDSVVGYADSMKYIGMAISEYVKTNIRKLTTHPSASILDISIKEVMTCVNTKNKMITVEVVCSISTKKNQIPINKTETFHFSYMKLKCLIGPNGELQQKLLQ